MDDLKLLLILLGALIIIAVIVFNWWQERRLKNETAQRFDAPKRDVLMDEFQINTDTVITDDNPHQVGEGSRRAYEPLETPTVPDEFINDDSAVARAVSALREFEDDIAAPIVEEPAPETSVSYTPGRYDVEPESHSYQNDAAQPTHYETGDVDDTPQSLISESGFEDSSSRRPPYVYGTNQPESVTPEPEEDYAPVSLPDSIYHPIDLTALLYLPQPLSGLQLRDFFLSFADVDKAVYAYGQDLDDRWQLLTRDHEATDFKRVACSLQLADRGGSVSREPLNRFQSGIDQIGQELAAHIEWHGSADPLRFAQELDQFCIDVDKLVGFHLLHGESGPFTGTKFRGLAEASGLLLGEDGSFHYEVDGQRQFSLVNHDGSPFSPEILRSTVIRAVSFQLDIPRVMNCTEVFNHMVLSARQISHGLNAKLVDDNQRPIGEMQIERIRQQLKVIHTQMVARGVVPGSACALRLFS